MNIQKILFFLFSLVSLNSYGIGFRNLQIIDTTTVTPIRGQVLDSLGTPLAGVSVYPKNRKIGTTTDFNGRFTLDAKFSRDTLIIRYLGYQEKHVYLQGKSYITVTLKSVAEMMKEVEVVGTGYQTISREKVTGSFAVIDQELLNRRVSTDIISRLENISPGLLFDTRLGGTPSLSIRGQSTIYANDQPLIVLDNFPYDGDMNNINPNDIENITILKDASAASIWGVRAGNGVIVMNTRKGRKNQPLQLSFNTNTTIAEKPDVFSNPAFLNTSDFIDVQQSLFAQGFYTSWINDLNHPTLSPVVEMMLNSQLSESEKTTSIDALRGYDVRNDIKKYLFQNTLNQQYSLNLRGGSEKTTWYFSSGYDDNQEKYVGNNFKRFNLNSMLSFNPVKNLDISSNMVYTQTGSGNNALSISDLNAGSSGLGLYPYARLADDQGNALALEHFYRDSYKQQLVAKGLLNWDFKPLEEQHLNNNRAARYDIRINTNLKYRLPLGFSIDLRYQYERELNSSDVLYDKESYYARNMVNRYTDTSTGSLIRNIPMGAIYDQGSGSLVSHTGRVQLNYDRRFNYVHSLSGMLGMEVKQLSATSFGSRLYGYDPDVLTYGNVSYGTNFNVLPNSSISIPTGVSRTETVDRFRSWFGNLIYTFQDKYTFSLTGRIDQSNFFGISANQKSVPLWSTGIAWNVSEEPFFMNTVLPFLKLRSSYGFNGNLDKTVTSMATAAYLDNSYAGGSRAVIINAPNPKLRWEKIGIFNIAADFRLSNDVLTGSIDYYQKNGNDLLGYASLEPTTGIFNATTASYAYKGNFAKITGKGLDLVLNLKNVESKSFNYTSNLLFNYNTDQVKAYDVKLNANTYLNYGSGVSGISPFKGYPVYSIYAYKWAGLDPENGDPQGFLNGVVSKDYGAIANETQPEDLIYMGRALPSLFGSLRNTLSLKSWSLSFNIAYKFNYYFTREGISYSRLFKYWSGHQEFSDRWMKQGDEAQTSVPSMPLASANQLENRDLFYLHSEALVEKGDHIRLQDIQLSYTLSKGKTSRLAFKHIQVYAYANNLGIIWRANKQHLDPDYLSTYTYPPMKSVALGLRTSF